MIEPAVNETAGEPRRSRRSALARSVYTRDLPGFLSALAAGADPNETDEEGASALRRVCERHRFGKTELEMARALLSAGANPKPLWLGCSPLGALARGGGEWRVLAARELLAAGAGPDGEEGEMAPALAAAFCGRAGMLWLLVSSGATMSARKLAEGARDGGFPELGMELLARAEAREIAGAAASSERSGGPRRV